MDRQTEKRAIRPEGPDTASAVGMLYDAWREENHPDPENIRIYFSELNDILEKLPLEELDNVWYRVCALCIAHEKRAFFEGFRMGARLMTELEV